MAQRRNHHHAPPRRDTTAPRRPATASCPEDLGIDTDFQVNGAYETAALGSELETITRGRLGSNELQWWAAGGHHLLRDDYNSRGPTELAVHSAGMPFSTLCWQARAASPQTLRAALRARSQAVVNDQSLAGIDCGPGGGWIDSRCEQGPPDLYYGGDAIWAHGGHAGGPTFGSFTPAIFQTGGAWNRQIRAGFARRD